MVNLGTKMRKLALCLALVVLLSSMVVGASAEGPVTVTLESVAVEAGERAEIIVSIGNNPGVSGASFTLVCDSDEIELVDIQPIARGSFVKHLESGSFSWLMGSDVKGDFQLVKLCFETGAPGRYEVNMRLTGGNEGNLTNSKSEAVELSFRGAVLTVNEPGQSGDTGNDPGGDTGGKESPMNAFTDLSPEAWYSEGIEFVLSEGIMNGMDEGIFAPSLSLSRAMLVTMLYRMAGEPEVGSTSPFDDVKPGKWYTDAVVWASGLGIVDGYGDGSFGPGQPVTREQAALIFHRFAIAIGLEASARGDLSAFEDGAQVNSWAEEAVSWAYGCGLMKGRSERELAPGASITRSEGAVLLWRWCSEII